MSSQELGGLYNKAMVRSGLWHNLLQKTERIMHSRLAVHNTSPIQWTTHVHVIIELIEISWKQYVLRLCHIVTFRFKISACTHG